MTMIKSIAKKLRDAARKLNCKPEDIWEDLAAGYVDNIPSYQEIIEDIENYVIYRKGY